MPTNYPDEIDNPEHLDGHDLAGSYAFHEEQHENERSAIISIESELGLNPSGAYATVAERLSNTGDGGGTPPKGDPGVDGKDGEDGAPGEPGADGVDGSPGAAGQDGTDGANGEPGQDGEDGADGAPGEPGQDADPAEYPTLAYVDDQDAATLLAAQSHTDNEVGALAESSQVADSDLQIQLDLLASKPNQGAGRLYRFLQFTAAMPSRAGEFLTNSAIPSEVTWLGMASIDLYNEDSHDPAQGDQIWIEVLDSSGHSTPYNFRYLVTSTDSPASVNVEFISEEASGHTFEINAPLSAFTFPVGQDSVTRTYVDGQDDLLQQQIDTKSSITHNHDAAYQAKGSYASSSHNHDGKYQAKGSYAPTSHTHDYWTAVDASQTRKGIAQLGQVLTGTGNPPGLSPGQLYWNKSSKVLFIG